MPDLTDEEVVSLVRRLPPERKRQARFTLAQEARLRMDERLDFGEEQLRGLAKERGLNWDSLSEQERESLVDDLLHGK